MHVISIVTVDRSAPQTLQMADAPGELKSLPAKASNPISGANDSSCAASAVEIVEFARFIGMDPVHDSHLLWICEEALAAPLPDGWTEHSDSNDDPYYHCRAT